MNPTSEAAFETVIESHLLAHGYTAVPAAGFDRARALFPAAVLDFIRSTQPKEWAKLEGLLGARVDEQILSDLVTWLALHGALCATGSSVMGGRCGWRFSGRPMG